jgi:hypothetical protein
MTEFLGYVRFIFDIQNAGIVILFIICYWQNIINKLLKWIKTQGDTINIIAILPWYMEKV